MAENDRLGIVAFAVTGHSSADNVPAVMRVAEARDLLVIPGMEVCTREEIHVLALFETLDAAFEMQSVVYAHLQSENDPDVCGMQVIANELDEVEGFETRLLIGTTDLPWLMLPIG